jgi:putative heme-binding domain-containing protein
MRDFSSGLEAFLPERPLSRPTAMKLLPSLQLGAFLWLVIAAHAVEPWVDRRLDVVNGVALWLDATHQNPARVARGIAPLSGWGDPVDLLFDGSGHGRHLSQPIAGQRPGYSPDFTGASLSFDGNDDSLGAMAAGFEPRAATVFLVASVTTNAGGFRGLFCLSALGRNDYQSGLSLDLGRDVSASAFQKLNAEGAGFSGETNLRTDTQPIDGWQLITLSVGEDVRLFLDGAPQGRRARTPGILGAQQIVLGARHYSNTDGRPSHRGFLEGHVAEWLVYDRLLNDAERQSVEAYLRRKHLAHLTGGGTEGHVLGTLSNPPPVKVMMPGFRADRLPLRLNNLNNVKYRADGVLVANSYDGRVLLLRDTDGDGLEDRSDVFFDSHGGLRAPVGLALTPPGYPRGDGVFIAAKDRVVLIVDTNRDDRADQEITVATWTERSEQQGVDALGVAIGPDGSVYFGLGAASFTDGYVTDRETGRSRFPGLRERGTLQRVSPDFSRREAVARGVRFLIALAFNRHGDLFATEQEGATWLPNGNPFDELLHLPTTASAKLPHFGFPPRHPRLLPDVIDEPSVFDYAPQHQSAVGLNFNEPVAGGPVFGPASWAGDALVSGYSRGKLYRTQLAKTPAGYVAQNHLLATLQELVMDAAPSPRGDLLVATHGGQPDWGSGPSGTGTVWRIRRSDTNAALPTAIWAAGPSEFRVAFDRPIDAAALTGLAARATGEVGEHVFPGDRFEGLWPGYQVVHLQRSAPRQKLTVESLALSPDRRTLSLRVPSQLATLRMAVALPAFAGGAAEDTYELPLGLNGLSAEWRAADGRARWDGWLPHADLDVARAFTAGSAEHDRLWALMAQPGTLTLRGQLDLYEMLQPAIQAGASLDYVRPPEFVTVAWAAGDRSRSEQHISTNGWLRIEWAVSTRPDVSTRATWFTADDARPRALPLRRFLVPWAVPPAAGAAAPGVPKELAGADWKRGRALFQGERLACARCHALRGEGGHVGPDLSNLVHRDIASVRRDIEFPNAALNPDHAASVIELIDDDDLTAIILGERDGRMTVADATGTAREIQRSKVKSVRPASLSLMPEGLWATLSTEEQRDLLAFLLTSESK